MKRTVAGFLAVAAFVAPTAALGSINVPNNNGHPATNPAEQCPPGQNKDATPGALHKCP